MQGVDRGEHDTVIDNRDIELAEQLNGFSDKSFQEYIEHPEMVNSAFFSIIKKQNPEIAQLQPRIIPYFRLSQKPTLRIFPKWLKDLFFTDFFEKDLSEIYLIALVKYIFKHIVLRQESDASVEKVVLLAFLRNLGEMLLEMISAKATSYNIFYEPIQKTDSKFDQIIFNLAKIFINFLIEENLCILNRNGVKNSYTCELKLDDSQVRNLNLSIFALNDLPMVIPPQDWVFDKSKNKFIGGYSKLPINFVKSDNMVSGPDDHSVTVNLPKNNTLLLKYTNKMQQKVFAINPRMMIYFEALILDSKRSQFFPMTHQIITCDEDKDLGDKPIEKRSRRKKYNPNRKRIQTIYVKKTIYIKGMSTKRLIHRLIIRKLKWIARRPVYFVYTIDFRTRKYAQGLLSYTSNDLARSVFVSKDTYEMNDTALRELLAYGANFFQQAEEFKSFNQRFNFILQQKDALLSFIEGKLKDKLFLAKIKPKEICSFFSWLFEVSYLGFFSTSSYTLMRKESQFLIRLDAKASFLQHISCLTGSPLLELLNFVPSQEELDIYIIHLNLFKKELKNSSFLTDEAKSRLMQNLTRKFWKKIIMIHFYGASKLAICEEMCDAFLLVLTLYKQLYGAKEGESLYEKLVDKIYALFINFLERNCSDAQCLVNGLKTIVRWRAKNEEDFQGISWAPEDGVLITQRYVKLEEKRIKLTFSKIGQIKFSLYKKSSKLNVTAMARALPANLIHSLDALTMRETYAELERMHLDHTMVADIHDAIICLPGYRKYMVRAYARAIKNIYTSSLRESIMKDIFGPILLRKISDNNWKGTKTSESQKQQLIALHSIIFDPRRALYLSELLDKAKASECLLV